jgi:putative tricarboxylic transport membrane protein
LIARGTALGGALKKADFWSGLALAGLGTYVVVEARGWDYLTPEGPGAGFFPLWYGIAMIALSLVLVAGSVRGRGERGPRDTLGITRALALWVALAVSVGLLKVIGFAASFALLTFAVITWLYGKRWTLAAAIGIASGAAFYLLFVVALGVSLPAGPLGF